RVDFAGLLRKSAFFWFGRCTAQGLAKVSGSRRVSELAPRRKGRSLRRDRPYVCCLSGAAIQAVLGEPHPTQHSCLGHRKVVNVLAPRSRDLCCLQFWAEWTNPIGRFLAG